MFLSLPLPFVACAPASLGLRGGRRGVGDRGSGAQTDTAHGRHPRTPSRHEAGVSAPLCVRPQRQRRVQASSGARLPGAGSPLPLPGTGGQREATHPAKPAAREGSSPRAPGASASADSGGPPALCHGGSPHPTRSSPLAAQAPQVSQGGGGGSWKTGKTKNRDSAAPNLRACLFPATQKGDRYPRGSETWQGCGGRALILPPSLKAQVRPCHRGSSRGRFLSKATAGARSSAGLLLGLRFLHLRSRDPGAALTGEAQSPAAGVGAPARRPLCTAPPLPLGPGAAAVERCPGRTLRTRH